MLGIKDDKKETKKDEQKDEQKDTAKHIRTEGHDTHHDLLPEVPVEKVTDTKTRATKIEQGPETEVVKKQD